MVKKKETVKKANEEPKKNVKVVKTDRVEKSEVDVQEKISEGWIHISSILEVMAINKEVVEQSLSQHIERLERENGIIVVQKKYSTIEKVENPPRRFKEAHSQFVEVQILVRNYSMVIYYVFNYGPSSVEILKPDSIILKQGEAQDVANALASMIHQFASNAGGVVISKRQ